MAYVCLVPSISIGTSIFVHENTCVTLSEFNQAEYLQAPNLALYVAVKWVPSVNRLHPHIKAFHDGHLFDTYDLNNQWEYAWACYDIPNITGRFIFQFLPDYGAEPEMSIFCDVVDELDRGEVDEEASEWEGLPDIEESGYFKVIRDLIEDESDKTNSQTATTLLSIGATNTNISNLIAGLNNDDNTKLTNDVNDLVKEYNYHFNLENGVYASYLNDIKHSVDNLDIPDMDTMNSNISNLTSAMNALNIPDLSITNEMLSGLKESVDSLDTSGIAGLSGDIHDSEQTTIAETNSIQVRQSTFHNYTYNHLNNIHNALTDSVQQGWMALGGAIGGLSIPTVSEIVEGIGDITPELPDITFPTIDGIKEAFISAASEIADKILERVWNEIERRYEK